MRIQLLTLLALGTLCAMTSNANANPSMLGDTVDLYSTPQLTGVEGYRDSFVVVNPDVEYTTELELYDLQLSDTTILLDSQKDWFSPYFNSGFDPSSITLKSLDIPGSPGLRIGSIDVDHSREIVRHENTPEPWPDFSPANVTFGDHEVDISYGGYSFPEGSQVLVTLYFVPEPGGVAMMLVGSVIGAMWWRRRGS